MIENEPLRSWKDLQNRVCQILRECGVEAQVERRVRTARGIVVVDVWAYDNWTSPAQTYLIECKYWRRPVPKSVIHSLRTVVEDCGANWGAVVSRVGFQAGAIEAAKYSNIRLLSWAEFQELFVERWYRNHFIPALQRETWPLTEYVEPINTRVLRKADCLPESQRRKFILLRQQHADLEELCLVLRSAHWLSSLVSNSSPNEKGSISATYLPTLPLRARLGVQFPQSLRIPDELLDQTSFRGLLENLIKYASQAIAEFDELFGGRV